MPASAIARTAARRHAEMAYKPAHRDVSCVSASSQPSQRVNTVHEGLNAGWLHIWLHVPTPEALSQKGKGL